MTKAFAIVLISAFGLAAQAPANAKTTGTTKPAAKAAAKKPTAKAPTPVTIPTDAVAKPDGTYSWTDKQGKNWTFAKTPFGVMKTATEASPAPNTLADVKTFDEGEKVRFETPTPFGVIKREKNKADLTDDERALFNKQNSKQD
jgi:hypothetical protein